MPAKLACEGLCRVRIIVSNHAPRTCSVLAGEQRGVVAFLVIMSTRPWRCECEVGLKGEVRNLPAPTVTENCPSRLATDDQ